MSTAAAYKPETSVEDRQILSAESVALFEKITLFADVVRTWLPMILNIKNCVDPTLATPECFSGKEQNNCAVDLNTNFSEVTRSSAVIFQLLQYKYSFKKQRVWDYVERCGLYIAEYVQPRGGLRLWPASNEIL